MILYMQLHTSEYLQPETVFEGFFFEFLKKYLIVQLIKYKE